MNISRVLSYVAGIKQPMTENQKQLIVPEDMNAYMLSLVVGCFF